MMFNVQHLAATLLIVGQILLISCSDSDSDDLESVDQETMDEMEDSTADIEEPDTDTTDADVADTTFDMLDGFAVVPGDTANPADCTTVCSDAGFTCDATYESPVFGMIAGFAHWGANEVVSAPIADCDTQPEATTIDPADNSELSLERYECYCTVE